MCKIYVNSKANYLCCHVSNFCHEEQKVDMLYFTVRFSLHCCEYDKFHRNDAKQITLSFFGVKYNVPYTRLTYVGVLCAIQKTLNIGAGKIIENQHKCTFCGFDWPNISCNDGFTEKKKTNRQTKRFILVNKTISQAYLRIFCIQIVQN